AGEDVGERKRQRVSLGREEVLGGGRRRAVRQEVGGDDVGVAGGHGGALGGQLDAPGAGGVGGGGSGGGGPGGGPGEGGGEGRCGRQQNNDGEPTQGGGGELHRATPEIAPQAVWDLPRGVHRAGESVRADAVYGRPRRCVNAGRPRRSRAGWAGQRDFPWGEG